MRRGSVKDMPLAAPQHGGSRIGSQLCCHFLYCFKVQARLNKCGKDRKGGC